MDKYEQELETNLKLIKECKEKKEKKSCSKCDEFFGCDIREQYVQAVYYSMNKGESGGFDF